jgi:hypothetical protein
MREGGGRERASHAKQQLANIEAIRIPEDLVAVTIPRKPTVVSILLETSSSIATERQLSLFL